MNLYQLLAFIAIGTHAAALTGEMTMWTSNTDVITTSMCGYAQATIGGLASPAITNSAYFPNRFFCAANQQHFPNSCGNCYRIQHSGSGGTDPSRAGEAVIQIVDAMTKNLQFDCLLPAFEQITGASTGRMPITYEQVDCTLTAGGPKLTVIDGGNSWNTKVIVSNAESSITGVQMTVNGRRENGEVGEWSFNLLRSLNSAEWHDGPQMQGEHGVASFVATQSNGPTLTFDNCFNDWPVDVGDSCTLSGAAPVTKEPTPMPTPSPTSPVVVPSTPEPTPMPTPAPTNHVVVPSTSEPTPAPTNPVVVVPSTSEPTPMPTPAPTNPVVVPSTSEPTPAPTRPQQQQGGACYIQECGCPEDFLQPWCSENSQMYQWCAESEIQCEGGCAGVWC